MSSDLPHLVGSLDQVAEAMEVREQFLQAMDLAGLESWRRFQRSHCDEWEQLMEVDLDQAFAFDLLRSKADAAWWLARREQTLAALAREILVSLPSHRGPEL